MIGTNLNDTIVAIATALGSGGIGVVRVSGSLVKQIALGVLGQCPAPRYAAYLNFIGEGNELIDRGIAIYYNAPHSYTGEDVLELQAHGGTALMQILLARCISLGARQAGPGEFTQRAYLNEKLDLAQAEAVADVINAATAEAAKSAVRSLSGEFSNCVNSLLSKLIDLRLYVEACLDFPEEEIDFITLGRVVEKLTGIQNELAQVFAKAKQGSLLREGINVVLVGQPNVGKSSLMNQLAGEEVAIVTPIAGTTRDTIKNVIQINGVPLHVMDTAGLRETDDEVEKFGIARTWRSLETAHIALLLVDQSIGITNVEKSIIDRLPQVLPKVWVHNKIDLNSQLPKIESKVTAEQNIETHIFISAKFGVGLDLLKNHLLTVVGWQHSADGGEGVFMARSRHLIALTEVSQHLENAAYQISSADLMAEELRLAQVALGSVTGEFKPDELLGEIFSRFCIGK